MSIFVNTVLNKQNYSNVEKMVDLCLNLKVNKWSLLQLGCVGYAKDHIANLALTTEDVINTAIRVAERVDPDFNDLKDLTFENGFFLTFRFVISSIKSMVINYPTPKSVVPARYILDLWILMVICLPVKEYQATIWNIV